MTDDPIDEMFPPLDDHEEHWHREYDSGMLMLARILVTGGVVMFCLIAYVGIRWAVG